VRFIISHNVKSFPDPLVVVSAVEEMQLALGLEEEEAEG